jgi:hypothetical protein
MAEATLIIPTDILKTIYNGVSSEAMGLKNIMIMVDNDRVIVKHTNDGRSGLLRFESRELKLDPQTVKLPIDVADLKTVVSLAKDLPAVVFVVGDGVTTCKIGKTKKQFAQPVIDIYNGKDPNFEVKAKLEFDDVQASDLVSTFSDLKEQGDLRITAMPEKVIFKVEESNRSTEIEFAAADLVSFTGSDAAAGYNLDMTISMFKVKQKGFTLNVEFGQDVPLRIIQKTYSGTMSILLAPKIYDE